MSNESMTSLFNIWNFFQRPDRGFEFDVTRANMPRMKDGTVEWVNSCLLSFGVDAVVSSWQVVPFRSHYFTDYRDSDDWKDQWQIGWTVQVFVEPEEPSHINAFDAMPAPLSSPDESWSFFYEDIRHDQTALLISTHVSERKAVEALAQEIVVRVELDGVRSEAVRQEIRSFNDHHQLRVLLAGLTFPDCVEKLDQLVDLCRSNGGWVNWREALI